MLAATFDTLKFAERLEAGGFTSEQARTAAQAFAEASADNLVTRGDLKDELVPLKTDLNRLEAKIEKMELSLTIRLGTMIFALGGLLVAIKFVGH